LDTKKPLLCTLTAIFSAGLYIYVPKLSPYAGELGASYKFIGIIVGAYGLTQMLIRIPLGMVSDRQGSRKLLIASGLILTAIAGSVVWAAPSPITLLILRILAGATAASWLAYTVLFSSYFPSNKTPKAIGIINVFFTLGQIVAMLSAGLISGTAGMRFLFLLTALLGVSGFFISLFIPEKRVYKKNPPRFSELIRVIQSKRLLKISGLAILTQIITFGGVFGFAPLVADTMGASDFELGLLATLGMLPGVFVPVIIGSFLVKRYSSFLLISVGYGISALYCILVPFSPGVYLLLVLQFFGGFGRGIVFPLLMGISIEHVPEEYRATAMGAFQSIYGIGMFLGPVLFGIFADSISLNASFFFGAVVGAAGIVLSTILLPQKGQ